MRWLLALLVVVNAFVFAMFQGWLSPWVRGDREPQRLSDQRNAERLRVVPLERLGGATLRAPAAAPSSPSSNAVRIPAAAPAAPGQPPPGDRGIGARGPSGDAGRGGAPRDDTATPPSETARAPAAAGLCTAFGLLDEQRASRLREALEAAGARVESTRIEQAASYLVYLPPADSPAEAQQRLAELRRIGHDDAFVMQDGALRLGVSVGLYRSEETARALVTRLEGLGETGLRIAPRGAVTVRVRVQARWTDAAAANAAGAIAGRFDAQTRDCD